MPVTIERLPGEPILLITYSGRVIPTELDLAAPQIEEAIADLEPPIFRISNTLPADVSFTEMVRLLPKVTMEHSAISTRDRRFIDIAVVGDNLIANLAANSLGQDQYGAARLTIFDNLDDALAHARAGLPGDQ